MPVASQAPRRVRRGAPALPKAAFSARYGTWFCPRGQLGERNGTHDFRENLHQLFSGTPTCHSGVRAPRAARTFLGLGLYFFPAREAFFSSGEVEA
jgi:hypothetical protein